MQSLLIFVLYPVYFLGVVCGVVTLAFTDGLESAAEFWDES